MSLSGEPLRVVSVQEDDKHDIFSLNIDELEKILLRKDVKDKKVCIVSVAGAFRKGKSFMLDFFLRYLTSSDQANWLGDVDQPLKGFPWRGGSERETTGILMWSEPFIVKTKKGEEVVIVLMDTQGSFDSKSTVRQCATVFALSTMLSSVQIYNISANIQEDNLQHLQLFTEYGRLALDEGSKEKPFQVLQFLIRDWSYPYEFNFGANGGKQLLEKLLKTNPEMHDEHIKLRKHLRSCFNELRCELLPHPGLKVSTSPVFDGRITDIDKEFLDELKLFIPSILGTENLVIKRINGQDLTCKGLVQYFKAYIKIYQSDEIPEPRTMLEATAEANNLNTLIICKDQYHKQMDTFCGSERPFVNPNDLETAHMKYKLEALKLFTNTKKMGSKEFCNSYSEKLLEYLDKAHKEYRRSNENKNVMRQLRTPATLFVMLISSYLLSSVANVFGVSALTMTMIIPFYISAVSLLTWLILTYVGSAPGIVNMINVLTEYIVHYLIIPTALFVHRRSQGQITGGAT